MLFTETESSLPLNSNLFIQYRDPLQESAVTTIAFVDSRVADAMTLMAGLQADVKVFLDPTRDGVAQITETLGHYQNLTGIDIVSHGNVAQVQLGNSFLSANSLQQYTHELKQWEASLTPDADILFYGCNIAAGDLGQAFVKDISTLTGGDVAASTDLTGNSALGGNWTLEYATGTIETQTSFTDSQINSYQGLLASVFTTETPAEFKTDGTGSAGDYELGMEFRSGKSGQISAIRYYKAPSETGTHTGRIWSSTGTLLASVTFTNETASGWQQQTLATPLNIQANTTYVVSVNSNTYYAFTSNGLGTTLTNGDLSAVADGSNGVYDFTPGSFPAQSYQNSNYFRDVVFAPTAPNPNNKPGTVSIGGTATQNQTLTANVADADGLTGVTINYQWQQSSNGTTWQNITGATNQTLTLDSSLIGQQVRANATYTDALGGSENILSLASSQISALLESVFTTETPAQFKTDGTGSAGDYELGMEFRSGKSGQISAIRYYKAPSETGTHTGRIWSSTGTLLASVTFTNETASGWQQQTLATPLNIQANTTYVVSVNSNTYYAFTSNGLGTTLTNGDLSAVADGSNGVYDFTPGSFPAQSYQNSNYFRDVVFAPTVSNPNNKPGTVAISGVTAQGNTLTANIADPDGLTGVSITYTWQQSSNGTTWQNITGATNQTLTLDSSLIGQQVRVNATYTDALGGGENILSLASSPISALLESIFTSTTTPTQPNFTDGPGVDYELGMKFTSAKAGQIQAIRYYKSPSEIGTHVGRIWSSTGTLLASVTFTNETASGWQQQALSTPVTIPANTTYVVSVNTNGYYADTPNGFATAITNGDLTAPVGAGVYNETISAFPTQVYQNENYFRDVVFAPTAPNPNNKPGTVSIGGTATQNQTLTANVADADGLTGVTINYQWQQSSNGTTWTNITGATSQTLTLAQAQVNQQVRVTATYTDALGSSENPLSTATSAVVNVNDPGTVILKGSATIGHDLDETVLDIDGLIGVNINYQWQQLTNSIWTNIAGSIAKSLTLTTALLGQQVRVLASYIDNLGSSENVASAGVTVAAQNAIVIENQKTGTTAWQISNLASNNEIAGYGDATSINKGQALNLKISLAQAGQYRLDVYRLGYYGGTGGRLVTSVTGLNGVVQAGPTTDPSTRLVEYKWNTSYTLQTGTDWTTGLYLAKLTDSRTGKQTYVQFVLRDDNRPADIGFQDSVSTTEAYNNYGGYSTYDANSSGGQRAYQVSFDRPLAAANLGLTNTDGFNTNNMLAWEYNMVRWQESQGYDVSYFTNIDTSINPLQLYSQNVFQVTGHDEYWSMEMMNNVTNARDKGINLAFFSANTAYWRVRFEPSSNGQANRVMTVYKDTSGIGTSGDPLDPIAQTDPSAATTLFRSPQVNRPENALMGVGYIGDTGNPYGGYDFVVSNASDPYYANTGLKNGDKLTGLVGYEWDGLLPNGFAPTGLVVLSQSPVPSSGLGSLGLLPPGTNDTISNAVRYTAASGAKVFSTGSVQWVWGLDSDGVTNPRVDIRVQQIAVNVLKDMGAKPKTPSTGIVV
jgi:hypothetical protein